MAELFKLESILGENDIKQLPGSIKSILENHLKAQHETIQELRKENSNLKATAERSEFQLEKELLESQLKFKETSESCQELKSQIKELETKLSNNQIELQRVQNSFNSSVTELEIVKKKNEKFLEENGELVQQLEKRRNDINKLNDEVKHLTDTLTNANESKYEALAKIEEIQLHEVNLEHQVKRLQQEKELLNEHISSLNEDAVQKGQEILTLRREKSSFVLELQSELEQTRDELQATQKQIKDMKKLLEEKDKRLEQLAKQIKDVKELQIQSEEQFQLELRSQNKLVELYKKSSLEGQERIDELMRAVEEMHKFLQETNELNAQLEEKLNDTNNQWNKQLEEKEKEIISLRKELKDANDILSKNKGLSGEGIEKLFPAAAATSKVLHSGMTLTQIYSEYIKSQEELQKEKTENQRLTKQLQQIVSEIEEKTPLVNQRFTEYQKALETISCLRNQLANSLTDQECLQTERDDAKRISSQLQNENKRLRKQLVDVSQQVCVLLKEVEESRGGHTSSYSVNEEELVSSSDETTAEKVISKHLVTFRDIEELQSKNQQLLAIVRDLSESQEEKEVKAIEDKTNELHQELEKSMSQLQELQKERSKQTELIESIVRQRDMYRVLLSQYQGHSSILSSSIISSFPISTSNLSPQKADETNIQETKSALTQLQKEFDIYKKEKTENTQILNEQIDKLREEVSELRIQNAKLSSQLDYSEERFNLLQSNADIFKREASLLREKNQKHTASITQHQHTINTLRQEVMSLQEKLSKAEVLVENLQAERNLLQNVETRLLQEKESLLREKQQQSRLMANLQAVQNNLERLESETNHHLKAQVEKLEKECELLKSKLESEKEKYGSSVKIWEKQVEELQHKIEKEVERSHKTHDELVEAYAHIHELKQEATANIAKLAAAEAQLSKFPVSGIGKGRSSVIEVKNLKEQLSESQNDIKKLQEKLNLSEKNINQYRTLASDLESQLKEQTELNNHLKEGLEKSIKEKEEAQEKLEKKLEECEKQCRQLIHENVNITEESTNKVNNLNKDIALLQRELQISKQQANEAIKKEKQTRDDCQKQAKLMQEAQEKYERELLLHSQDILQLRNEKNELESFKSKVETAEAKSQHLEETLTENKLSWDKREKMFENEIEVMRKKCEDLANNNNVLLNQIELLSRQMAAVQSKDWNISTTPIEDENKSTQQLLEVIRFLRREKEIAVTENEALQSENIRLKTQTEYLNKELKELQKSFIDEQAHIQTMASTEVKHAELLKKIEMFNVLSESNRLLRDEKESLVQTQMELENKIEQIDKEMGPIKELKIELSSQVDALSAENIALRSEVKRWQTRTNQLLEQTHKMGPEDYKQLSKENENLHKQVATLTEELHKKQAELSLVNASLTYTRKDVENLKAEIMKEKSQSEHLKQQLENSNKESADRQKTILQVKRIARKYKTQYDELKSQYDDVIKKLEVLENNGKQETSTSQESRQEIEEKLKDSEDRNKLMADELGKLRETVNKMTKDEEEKNELLQKEERARKVMQQAKQRINQLCEQKDALIKEKENLMKENEEIKIKISSLEEESQKINNLKTLYETKVPSLERELVASKENCEKLEKHIEELNQKISQQRQISKPSTSAGPVDRGSLTAEPLTANIKPLAPSVQQSVTTLTVRHSSHSHSVTTVTRTTPTASIRPIAIGTVSTSVTVPSQTRMAAILPTTATASNTASTSEEEVRSISSPTSSHLSPALPQATVQPTPTIPTATVTSVVVIGETPSAAIAPSSHTISLHEPSSSSSSVICMSEVEETAPLQELPPVSTLTSSIAPATALVSPRVEITEDTSEQTELSDTTASPSVIVSPSGFSSGTNNITQTQVVVPTVKRQREELVSHSESSEHGLAHPKRIRMKSEGSQTTQQLTPEISDSGSNNINIAIVMSQPNTESVSDKKCEISITTDLSSEQEKLSDQGTTKKLPSTQAEIEDSVPTTSTKLKIPTDEEEVIIVESDDEKQKEESYDEQEGDDFNGEDMDDEDGDEGTQTDDYDDDHQMQEGNYSQADDDEMSSGPPFETEADNMSEQAAEEVEVVVLDDVEDNQMDAQDTTQIQNISVPIHLISNDPVPSVVTPCSTISTETLAVPSLPSRPALVPRIPGRSERFPGIVRQQLTFTINSQGPGYEEGGDSIVPSTPTLFLPHRVDGFAEAVSTTDTPSSQQGLSQLATQGSLSVDDTRMDLSQFDDGSGRSVPTTPLQVSPPEVTVTEVPDSVSLDQSNISGSPTTSTQNIPMITVSESIDVNKSIQSNIPSEPDTPIIQIVEVTGSSGDIETDQKTIGEVEETSVSSQDIESSGPIIVEIVSAIEENRNEDVAESSIEPDSSDVDPTTVVESETEKNTEASTSKNQTSQSRKPIIWDDGVGNNVPQPSSPQQIFSVPTSVPALRSQQQQPSPAPSQRATRGRRIRLRGNSSFSSSRNSGNWSGRRGRGSMGRGSQSF